MMKTSKFVVGFFSFILITNGLLGQVSLKGQVLEKETGKPLPAVHVLLHAYPDTTGEPVFFAVTDKKGQFSISGIPSDSYILKTSGVGYINYQETVDLEEVMNDVTLHLEEKILSLGEVIVLSLRAENNIRQVPLPVGIIDKKDVFRHSVYTIPDLLAKEPGVVLSRDGMWGTSVNIRGLSEQRLITMIDGNRLETATDLSAALSMIDPFDIERIEVIKGAASSIYGTGAMGGIVNVITGSGYYNNKPYLNGRVAGSYHTANSMYAGNTMIRAGSKNFHGRLNLSYRDADDVITPEGELPNSQFTDYNLSFRGGAKIAKNHEVEILMNRFRAEDVGIPGGAAFPPNATATYPIEKRDLTSISYHATGLLPSLNKLTLKYFNQYILRDVLLQPNPNVRITPAGKHLTNGLSLQTNWRFFSNHEVTGGIEAWQRQLSTSREKNQTIPIQDTSGTTVGYQNRIIGEIPIPESSFSDIGFFVQDNFFTLNNKLKVSLGGRFDYIQVMNKEAVDPYYIIIDGVRNETPPNQKVTFSEGNVTNVSWSANAGLLYKATSDLDITLNLARSFRSPSLEERYKYIDLGAYVDLGNPDLEPEQGYFFDLGTRYWGNRFNWKTNVFFNTLDNLIYQEPGIFVKEYTTGGVPDTLPALVNMNINEATLWGFDFFGEYNFARNFVLSSRASYVYGQDVSTGEPLVGIPPVNGQVGIRYRLPGWLNAETNVILFADKERLAENEPATSGYAIYNFDIHSQRINFGSSRVQLFGGIENIFDRSYKNHLSTYRGFIKHEPGRNFYLKLIVLW
ncbi:MAG: TonB-dependent receptor [Bacteroidales bacterium]